MKIFNLYQFNAEEYDLFTKFSNEYWNEPWCIYVECCGGENWCTVQVIDILNLKYETRQDVFLNVTKAYSNGFRLIMDFAGPVNILDGAEGMFHQGSLSVSTRLDNKQVNEGLDNYADILKKRNKIDFTRDLTLARLVMSPKDVQDYIDGKDVFFTEKQLKAFLKKKDLVNRK